MGKNMRYQTWDESSDYLNAWKLGSWTQAQLTTTKTSWIRLLLGWTIPSRVYETKSTRLVGSLMATQRSSTRSTIPPRTASVSYFSQQHLWKSVYICMSNRSNRDNKLENNTAIAMISFFSPKSFLLGSCKGSSSALKGPSTWTTGPSVQSSVTRSPMALTMR